MLIQRTRARNDLLFRVARKPPARHFLAQYHGLTKRCSTASIRPRVERRVCVKEPTNMRLMIMHKNDPKTEAGEPPPMELIQKMGAFIGEHLQAGRFLDGAGLAGSSTRTRLVFRNGECTAKRGP